MSKMWKSKNRPKKRAGKIATNISSEMCTIKTSLYMYLLQTSRTTASLLSISTGTISSDQPREIVAVEGENKLAIVHLVSK